MWREWFNGPAACNHFPGKPTQSDQPGFRPTKAKDALPQSIVRPSEDTFAGIAEESSDIPDVFAPAVHKAAYDLVCRRVRGNQVLRSLKRKVLRFLQQEHGPTAVEYAVMLAAIIVVCIGAIATIGSRTQAMFNNIELNQGAS